MEEEERRLTELAAEITVRVFLFKRRAVKIEAFDGVFEERQMIFYA